MNLSARFRAPLLLATAAGALLVSAPGARALAPEPGAPVTAPDAVVMYPEGQALVDVLANDVDPDDPDNSQLEICRLPTASGDVDLADVGDLFGGDGSVAVELGAADLTEPLVVEYYVCDHSFLTRSTLTVTVRDVAPVTVRKVRGKPGRLEVVNRNDSRIVLSWFANGEEGGVRVPADSTRVIKVHSRVVRWLAHIGHLRNFGVAGQGVVEGIKVPKNRPRLPAGGDTAVGVDVSGYVDADFIGLPVLGRTH